MTLSCCNKTVSITKTNNINKNHRFLLFELHLFFHKRKQKRLSWKSLWESSILIWLMIKKILKHFHALKSIKHPSVIYFDYESSSEKTNDCEKHFTTDVNNHKPCCLAMSMKYGYNDDKKIVNTFITVMMLLLMSSVNYSKLNLKNNQFQNERNESIGCCGNGIMHEIFATYLLKRLALMLWILKKV